MIVVCLPYFSSFKSISVSNSGTVDFKKSLGSAYPPRGNDGVRVHELISGSRWDFKKIIPETVRVSRNDRGTETISLAARTGSLEYKGYPVAAKIPPLVLECSRHSATVGRNRAAHWYYIQSEFADGVVNNSLTQTGMVRNPNIIVCYAGILILNNTKK